MKIFRTKFNKLGDMIYISHLDLQQLLQRAFRRAQIRLVHSQGFNPHPKISYGNALALGTESLGEYFDVELEDDLTTKDYLDRMNKTLPEGIKFLEAIEIDKQTPSLSSIIEYGEYSFKIEENLDKDFVEKKLNEFLSKDKIIITKKNKKGKMVENDIKPLIKTLRIVECSEDYITIEAIINTGSKSNLNTNILVPKLLEALNLSIDPLDVDILRKCLYKLDNEKLVSIM